MFDSFVGKLSLLRIIFIAWKGHIYNFNESLTFRHYFYFWWLWITFIGTWIFCPIVFSIPYEILFFKDGIQNCTASFELPLQNLVCIQASPWKKRQHKYLRSELFFRRKSTFLFLQIDTPLKYRWYLCWIFCFTKISSSKHLEYLDHDSKSEEMNTFCDRNVSLCKGYLILSVASDLLSWRTLHLPSTHHISSLLPIITWKDEHFCCFLLLPNMLSSKTLLVADQK